MSCPNIYAADLTVTQYACDVCFVDSTYWMLYEDGTVMLYEDGIPMIYEEE